MTRRHAAAFTYRLLDVADDKERNDSVGATYRCDPADRSGDVTGVPATAVNCLSAIGVIAGYPDGSFRPSVALTRQHIAAFVFRTLDVVDDKVRNDSVECDRSSRFRDVDGVHAAAINCLADLGLYSDEPLWEIPPDPLVFSSISAGIGHVCGILRDTGEVRCWGSNLEEGRIVYYGQADPPNGVFSSVSAGSEATCGIRPDQKVECWGGDDYGESSPPRGRFTSVSAGGNHACGLRSDGTRQVLGSRPQGSSFSTRRGVRRSVGRRESHMRPPEQRKGGMLGFRFRRCVLAALWEVHQCLDWFGALRVWPPPCRNGGVLGQCLVVRGSG